jgi:hypothetical protein
MKKTVGVLLLFALLCLYAQAVPAQTLEPVISLKSALSRAESYVKRKKIPTSALFLAAIHRDTDPTHPKNNGWVIIWAPKDPDMMDGELRVRVFDTGRVFHGGSS